MLPGNPAILHLTQTSASAADRAPRQRRNGRFWPVSLGVQAGELKSGQGSATPTAARRTLAE